MGRGTDNFTSVASGHPKMLVYRDIITGDQILSDAFPLKQVIDEENNVVEGLMYCESQNIQVGGKTVNNVIHSFQYNRTQVGSIADFKSWIKEYMNGVRIKLRQSGKPKEEIQAFMGQAPNIAIFLLKKFNSLQFYLGSSLNPQSMVYSLCADGATTPCFYFIMGALVQENISISIQDIINAAGSGDVVRLSSLSVDVNCKDEVSTTRFV